MKNTRRNFGFHIPILPSTPVVALCYCLFAAIPAFCGTKEASNSRRDAVTTSITSVPIGRVDHTQVWTGTEMIVWGGFNLLALNSGGRYNSATDSWSPVSTVNTPSNRYFHTAVWSGNEMIVWGGRENDNDYLGLNTGGRYNPTTDSWIATNMTGAPAGRSNHTAVWTGSEMIVWGGFTNPGGYFNDGGRYNPTTDTWSPISTSNAPAARAGHTAVWTDNEMIIYGGNVQGHIENTGGRYNPITDTWAPISTINAPVAIDLTAVWTGNEMIVWGWDGQHRTSGKYDPVTDTWAPMSTINAPVAIDPTAVWTGSEMILWGGNNEGVLYNAGGRYNPTADTWTETSTDNAPVPRESQKAIWADTQMLIWGGVGETANVRRTNYLNSGGRYEATTDSWSATEDTTSQITPDGTSCAEISSGTATDLTSAIYRVGTNGAISRVTPDKFMYWVIVTLPAGRNNLSVSQTITTANFSGLFKLAGGSSVLNSATCEAVSGASFRQSSTTGAVRIFLDAPTTSSYYIALEFSTQNLRHQPAPTPTMVHYDLSTTNASGSTCGLDLIKH